MTRKRVLLDRPARDTRGGPSGRWSEQAGNNAHLLCCTVPVRVGSLIYAACALEENMKTYRQLSLFLANTPGTLRRVCEALAKEKINILAHSVGNSLDYAVFRCVVSDSVRAVHLLESAGVFLLENDVLGLSIDDKPGMLAPIAGKLADARLNIDYAYGSAAEQGAGAALLVLKTDDLERTRQALA